MFDEVIWAMRSIHMGCATILNKCSETSMYQDSSNLIIFNLIYSSLFAFSLKLIFTDSCIVFISFVIQKFLCA